MMVSSNSLLIANTAAGPVFLGLFLHGWRGAGALLGHVCAVTTSPGAVTLHPLAGHCPASDFCRHPCGVGLIPGRAELIYGVKVECREIPNWAEESRVPCIPWAGCPSLVLCRQHVPHPHHGPSLEQMVQLTGSSCSCQS